MKNPYIYSYLPLMTVILFSMTFGICAVTESLSLFKGIGVYAGMREFLSDIELRLLLLIVFSLMFFMVFSALKLIGETIHEVGLLFFSKDQNGETINVNRGSYVVFFFGAIASVFGVQSFVILIIIFGVTAIMYFVFMMYKTSLFMSTGGTIGLILFEIIVWTLFGALVLYAVLKLYNGVLASLPFAK